MPQELKNNRQTTGKKRRKARRKRRRKMILFAGALILTMGFSGLWIKQNSGDSHPKAVIPPLKSHIVETGEQSGGEDWKLLLVNKWNPISGEDNVETVELPNGECVDQRIYEPLSEMFEAMEDDGIYPVVVSGYRTKQEQEDLYNNKIAAYETEGMSPERAKEEAERWVAVPGTSEHQLGLAVDINADGINSTGYEVYRWLEKNAHLYGFIYRYPEDKTYLTGVANEPWHYRYVGNEAAEEIYEQGICLEEYLDKTD